MLLCIFVAALVGAFAGAACFCRVVFGNIVLLWVPVAMVAVLLFDSLLAGLVCLLGFRAPTALPTSAANVLIACACMFCCCLLRSKNTVHVLPQERKVLAFDAFSFFVLLAFVALCGCVQFGADFDLNFSSTDPGTHYWAARVVLDAGALNGMYFTHYIAALFIEVLDPCLMDGYTFRAFIVSELLFLLMSAWVAYSLMRFLVGDGRKLLCLVMALLCTAGYPLNNLVFGFSYLGAGVTLLLTFACVKRGLVRFRKAVPWYLIVTIVETIALFITYSLFVPIAILSTALYLFARLDWWMIKHKMLSVGVGVFAIALIVTGIVLVVRSGFAEGLSAPGYSFTDLCSSFILVAPVAVAGLVSLISHRKISAIDPVAWLSISAIAATLVAFALCLLGVLSAYYYYKFYFVLWPCAFACAAYGLDGILKSNRAVFGAYAGVCCAVLVVSLSGIDKKLSEVRPDLNPAPMSECLTSLYSFNLSEMRSPKIPDEEVELWVAASAFRESEDDYVPLLGSNIDVYWYEAETFQRCPQGNRYYYFWLFDEDQCGQLLVDRLHEVDYCAVLHSQELPESVANCLAAGKRVFENEMGYVVDLS